MTNSSATPHFDLTPPREAQLRRLIDDLSDEERRVMVHHGDEEPFCGVFLAEKREGVFTCRLCGLPLFKAGTKFESGTGWPSFNAPFDEDHLRRVRDARYATETFEVVCARCGAQQGHVFADRGKPAAITRAGPITASNCGADMARQSTPP
jgi:peptide-methionine (R)-S-oxide reductase